LVLLVLLVQALRLGALLRVLGVLLVLVVSACVSPVLVVRWLRVRSVSHRR
jgi:hypothetical protein